MSDKTKKLEEFVAWVGGHIKGDEKGEAQIYLNYLFQSVAILSHVQQDDTVMQPALSLSLWIFRRRRNHSSEIGNIWIEGSRPQVLHIAN